MGMRLGTNALSLLAVPLNVHVLDALAEEQLPLAELSRAVGHPPATTTRSHLRTLTEWGIISREREAEFPGAVSYSITSSGRGMMSVVEVLRRWLSAAPDGPLSLGGTGAKSAIKALLDGWSTGLMRALAARPFALTELSRLLPQTSYPTLERRLTAMRRVGLLSAERKGANRGTPYEITPWLRRGIAPLSAAAHWEQQFAPRQAEPVGKVDVEAMFLLAIPLLELSPSLSGSCRLAVEMRSGSDLQFAGATASFEAGRLLTCVTQLSGEPDAWASGTALDWVRSMSGHGQRLEIGGDADLAASVVDGLRASLAAGDAVPGTR
jgi:DNA-binding HxlR family transcriptional regulator